MSLTYERVWSGFLHMHLQVLENTEILWNSVQELLKADIPSPGFETWIAPLKLKTASETHVVLETDSGFNRDWVVKKFKSTIIRAFQLNFKSDAPIKLDVEVLEPLTPQAS